MKKIFYKNLNLRKLLFIFLILFIFLCVSFYLKNNYKYLVGNSLLNDTQIIFDGDIYVDEQPVYNLDSNNLIGPFRNKIIAIDNINNVDDIYNVFKFTGLTPDTQYNVEFEFYIKGIDETTPLIVGTQQVKGENYVDEETGKISSNIDLKDKIKFSKGYSDYISIPLTFTTNDEGNIYIVVGIESQEKKVLNYEISHVRLVL